MHFDDLLVIFILVSIFCVVYRETITFCFVIDEQTNKQTNRGKLIASAAICCCVEMDIVYVVVPLFLVMVMHDNEFKTKENI